jgi:hypothetical protein
MKHFLLSLAIVFISLSYSFSQTITSRDGTVVYNKGDKAAAVIDLPYEVDVVEKTIEDYFKSKGFKSSVSRGFKVFRNVPLGYGSEGNSDLYFKAERKSRQEKGSTLLYMVATRPGEDLSTRVLSDRDRVDDAKLFLNDLVPYFTRTNTDFEIAAQEKVLADAEKKYSKLKSEQSDLEKKIENLKKELEKNIKDQENQAQTVAKEKEVLEALKQKRANQ